MKKKCLLCGHELKELIEFDNMPAGAQDIPSFEELAKDFPIDLSLCQCEYCGLVQFDTDPVRYYKDVIRAGGGSTTMKELRLVEYERLLRFMSEHYVSGRKIVEIGCGKGEFLDMWKFVDDHVLRETASLDLSCAGIENDPDFAQAALDKGLQVFSGFAEGNYEIPDGKYDAFIQFNFLEHQPKPNEMLQNIWKNLNDDALGLVTVPSLEYILKYDGYYELIRDHIANYSIETISYLFQKNGFQLLHTQIVNRDTIEIIVKKSHNIQCDAKPEFSGVFADITGIRDNEIKLKNYIKQYLSSLAENNKTMAIWGAGHQGFTLASTTDLKHHAKYFIDSAAFKQGRYAPASHIKIVAPDHFFSDPVDEILIVAPGYTDEIAGIIRNKYGNKVRILVLKSEKIREYAL